MSRITISLQDHEKTALRALAESEFREPRVQAALIIRQELEKRGLLQAGLATALPAQEIKQEGEVNVAH